MKLADELKNVKNVPTTKKVDGNAWAEKKAEMEQLGKSYAPIWLDSRIIETAKSIAKRLRVRYEMVLDAVLTDPDNYATFTAEMKKLGGTK